MLELTDPNIFEIKSKSMSGLCSLMERAENLKKISLKDNYIQDDGAKKISTGLQTNFSITQINLTFNLISANLNSEIEA
jgi:hypothetical protein